MSVSEILDKNTRQILSSYLPPSTGTPGPQGAQGAQGDPGATGPTGATGPRGPSFSDAVHGFFYYNKINGANENIATGTAFKLDSPWGINPPPPSPGGFVINNNVLCDLPDNAASTPGTQIGILKDGTYRLDYTVNFYAEIPTVIVYAACLAGSKDDGSGYEVLPGSTSSMMPPLAQDVNASLSGSYMIQKTDGLPYYVMLVCGPTDDYAAMALQAPTCVSLSINQIA